MAKKDKGDKHAAKGVAQDTNQLDWQNFNFLENLLLFCALKKRSVDKESGVHFRISSKAKQEAICLLFEIDRKRDPLIPFEEGPRPDFVVFYASGDTYLCTIVEMKGKDEKKLEHGIDQIIHVRDKLKEQLQHYFPKLLPKIKFQGILLTPTGSSVPDEKIKKIRQQQDFIIVVLQWDHKAELFNYISKKNAWDERYKHEKLP